MVPWTPIHQSKKKNHKIAPRYRFTSDQVVEGFGCYTDSSLGSSQCLDDRAARLHIMSYVLPAPILDEWKLGSYPGLNLAWYNRHYFSRHTFLLDKTIVLWCNCCHPRCCADLRFESALNTSWCVGRLRSARFCCYSKHACSIHRSDNYTSQSSTSYWSGSNKCSMCW